MGLKRVALVVVAAGAVLVSASSAGATEQHIGLPLALVPLQTAQLGPKNASFTLADGSGEIPNGEAGLNFFGTNFIGGDLGRLGRVDGYALDYGDPYKGSTGVMEIRSGVEEYKTQADAKKGLANWRQLGAFFKFFGSALLSVKERNISALPIGSARFATLTTLSIPNLNPIVRLDEQIVSGRFILDLTVTAGSVSAAEYVAPHLLLELRRRLELMVQGKPVGTRVPLPRYPQPGQAPGGPDLSGMILQASDLGMTHFVNLFQGYGVAPPALSTFDMETAPAGLYDELLQQQIGWWSTPAEATYGEAYGGALSGGFFATDGTAVPVDMSSVSDPATGYVINSSGQGAAYITVTNGQAGEYIFASSSGRILASDVQSLAQAAANRLDAGLGP